jgi:hypothetical protein
VASLTDTLPNANASRRIIDPQNKGPNFLQGLARIADNVVGIGSRLYEQNEQETTRQRAAARQAQEDQVADAAASIQFDHAYQRGAFAPQRLSPEPTITPGGYVPIDSSLEGPPVPQDMLNGVNQVVRARAAEQQGRTTSGSSDIILEQQINELRARFPDREDLIIKAFREQGFEHFMFRDRDLQRQEENFNIETGLAGERTSAEAAYKNGLVPVGTAPAEAAVAGNAWLRMESDAARSRQIAEAVAAATAAERSQFEFQQKQSDRDVVSSAAAMTSTLLTPVFNQLQTLGIEAQSSGNEAAFNAAVPEIMANATLIGENIKATLRAQGATPEAIAQVDAQITSLRGNMTQFLEGPASQFAVSKRALDGLTTALNLDIAQTLPIFNGLKSVLGQSALSELFPAGAASLLPTSVLQELRGELGNISGAIDTTEERLTMRDMAMLLRGQTEIGRLSERQARDVMPTLAVAARAGQRDVAAGNAVANTDAFYNSTLQLASAAMSLQRGRQGDPESSSRGVTAAVQTLFNPTALQASLAFARTHPEDGRILINSNRAAANHLFDVAKNTQLGARETMSGSWSVEYQTTGPQAGQYAYRFNEDAYNRWARQNSGGMRSSVSPGSGGAAMSADQARRQPPAAIVQQVGNLNNSMNYIVGTTSFDEDFRGVSARQVRELLANGTVPPAMQQRRETDSSFATRLQDFRRSTSDAATEQIQFQTENTARARLIQQESGGDPTIVNSEGYGGRLQFGASRLADAARAGLVPPGTTGAEFAQLSVAEQARVEEWHFNDIDQQAQRQGITEYIGQTIGGVRITPDAIRAMAHLGGIGGVKRFVESGGQYNPADSNGTRLSDYGQRFG